MTGRQPAAALGLRAVAFAATLILASGCTSSGVGPTSNSGIPTASQEPTSTPSTTPAPSATPKPTTGVPSSCTDLGIGDGRIAFAVGNGQANGIGVVNSDGSDYHVIVEAMDLAGQPHGGTEAPSWAGPDRVVFSSNRAGGPDDWHIFSVDAGGGSPVQLTSGADRIEFHSSLSGDGKQLAFATAVATGDATEPYRDAGIVVADPDGRNERQLTVTPPGGVDEWPDVSPDGTRVAFSRGHVGDDGGLMVVNIDGSGLTRIVPGQMEPLRPRWSADGQFIVFSSNGTRFMTVSANVWVVAADGTELRQLTHASGGGQAFLPTWSPDDGYVAFVHYAAGNNANDLGVVSSAGGAVCTLWSGTRSAGAWDADWGPPSD